MLNRVNSCPATETYYQIFLPGHSKCYVNTYNYNIVQQY